MVSEPQESLNRPPTLAVALIRLSTGRVMREAVLGDLQEGFHRQAQTNVNAARLWYWRQAFASAAPLLRQRVDHSALASSVLVLVLSTLALAGVFAWQETVARGAAQAFAASFEAAPLFASRVVFVFTQMLGVAAVTLTVSLLTFRADRGLVENAVSRLTILALLVIAPPLFESITSSEGYSLSFIAPWILAMGAAISAGASMGAHVLAAGRRL